MRAARGARYRQRDAGTAPPGTTSRQYQPQPALDERRDGFAFSRSLGLRLTQEPFIQANRRSHASQHAWEDIRMSTQRHRDAPHGGGARRFAGVALAQREPAPDLSSGALG